MTTIMENVMLPAWSIHAVREDSQKYQERPLLTSSFAVTELVEAELRNVDREVILCIALDVKNRCIGINLVSMGSLRAVILDPPGVFKFLILANAGAFILVHNHPSGNTSPSTDDCNTTHVFKEAGEIMGIPLLDHIIVGDESFYSFADEGKLK